MQAAKISQYPVLSDNLAHPELYEDKWLSHQEIALTHIINEIFARAGIDAHCLPASHESLRSSMVKLYDTPAVAELHQHLHASVHFGMLKPSPASEYSSDVARDIGLRKRFINLFVKNYEESALRAAVVVVVGRQMPPTTRRSLEGEV
jgi:abnormal spindle-like microcephaly-associated protein